MSTFNPIEPSPPARWQYAFLPLLGLAVNSMYQPSGRLLGTRATYSTMLRTSPILCSLDALVLVVRCGVYCVVRRVGLRRALLMCSHDRFDERGVVDAVGRRHRLVIDLATRKKMSTSLTIRLGVLCIGVVWLFSMNDARWTAAWGWLFVGSFVPVELALQVYEWTAWLRCCSREEKAEAQTRLVGFMTKSHTKEIDDDYDKANDKDADSDLDVDMDGQLGTFHQTVLPQLHKSFLLAGSISQFAVVYWAFLDLVQPWLNRHILAVDMDAARALQGTLRLDPVLDILATPFFVVSSCLAFATAATIAALGVYPCICVAGYVSKNIMGRYRDGMLDWIAWIVVNSIGGCWSYYVAIQWTFLGVFPLAEDEMMWIYAMLLVELVVLGLLWASYQALSKLAIRVYSRTGGRALRDDYYTNPKPEQVGCIRLMTILFASLVVLVLWYSLRFDQSDNWWQHWRDALAVDGTHEASIT